MYIHNPITTVLVTSLQGYHAVPVPASNQHLVLFVLLLAVVVLCPHLWGRLPHRLQVVFHDVALLPFPPDLCGHAAGLQGPSRGGHTGGAQQRSFLCTIHALSGWECHKQPDRCYHSMRCMWCMCEMACGSPGYLHPCLHPVQCCVLAVCVLLLVVGPPDYRRRFNCGNRTLVSALELTVLSLACCLATPSACSADCRTCMLAHLLTGCLASSSMAVCVGRQLSSPAVTMQNELGLTTEHVSLNSPADGTTLLLACRSPIVLCKAPNTALCQSATAVSCAGARHLCVLWRVAGNFQHPEKIKADIAERNRFGRFYYRFPDGESGADGESGSTCVVSGSPFLRRILGSRDSCSPQPHLIRCTCSGCISQPDLYPCFIPPPVLSV
jgi:hypothetical protein